MQKPTPFLWFDNNAGEAVEFYTSIFPNSKIIDRANYSEGGPGPAGELMTATFELNGQQFMALNGGPLFPFTEAVSFVGTGEGQKELDEMWEKLLAGGGKEVQCGWLKDRFGLSWQVVPEGMGNYMGGPDPAGAQRAMAAMMQMVKLDIGALKRAYDGE